jgi:integrative and conjugative element protein (TIGR02256 family)
MQIAYKLVGPQSRLIFTPEALDCFHRNRQRGLFRKEAGGQLFARYEEDAIIVKIATGPYQSDRRSRYLFTPDPNLGQRDIDKYYEDRLHFIGNWHTHPQQIPVPSITDIKNTHKRFLASEHCLEAFVMVIVGLDPFPLGLYVSLVNAAQINVLEISQSSNLKMP